MRNGDQLGTIIMYRGYGGASKVKWDNGGSVYCSLDHNGIPDCRGGYVLKIAEGMHLRLCVKLWMK